MAYSVLTGSFSNDDGDAKDNAFLKMNLYFAFECHNCVHVNLFSTPIGLNTNFNFKETYEKLVTAVYVLQNT